MAWYRAYPGMAADPKFAVIAKVIGGTSRGEVLQVWVRCLEHMAERGNLTAFKAEEESITLGLPEELVTAIITQFTERDMIDGVAPTAWNRRQYKSDSSTERSQRSRDNKKQQTSGDATDVQRPPTVAATPTQQDATPPDTDSESDTDSENTVRPSDAAPAKRKRKPLPELTELTPALRALAGAEGRDADREFAKCKNWCADNGKTVTDPRLRNWLMSEYGRVTKEAKANEQPGRTGRFRSAAKLLRGGHPGLGPVGSDGHGADPGLPGREVDGRGGDGPNGDVLRIAGPELAGRGVDPTRVGEGAHGVEILPDDCGNSVRVGAAIGARMAGPAAVSSATALRATGPGEPRQARADGPEDGRGNRALQSASGEPGAGGPQVGRDQADTGTAGGEGAGPNPSDRRRVTGMAGPDGAADALDAYEREHGIPQLLHRNVA